MSVREKKCAYVGVLSFVGVCSITHHTVIYKDIHCIYNLEAVLVVGMNYIVTKVTSF